MNHKWMLPVLMCAGLTMVVACSKKEESDAPTAPAPEAAPAAPAAPAADAAPTAPAAAAETLTVAKEATLAMTSADLWKKVGDFNGLNTWHPAIAKSEVIKGNNNEVGAHRKLTLGDGAVIVEELAARDEAGMTLTYTIVESPLPVTDYRSTMTVTAEADGKSSKLTWASTFKPAAGAEPAKTQEMIGGIYQAGIDALAKP